jgi:hypothetical protein
MSKSVIRAEDWPVSIGRRMELMAWNTQPSQLLRMFNNISALCARPGYQTKGANDLKVCTGAALHILSRWHCSVVYYCPSMNNTGRAVLMRHHCIAWSYDPNYSHIPPQQEVDAD